MFAFVRGGSILILKDQLKRSALLARNDTGFNMSVYVSRERREDGTRSNSKGWLYFDDGETFNYERRNEYQVATVEYEVEKGLLRGETLIK